MRNVVLLGLLFVAVTVGAWMAGEMHRENCVRQDRVSCSVLPWDSGQSPPHQVKITYPGF